MTTAVACCSRQGFGVRLPRSACQTDDLLRNPPAGSPAGSKPYNRHKYALETQINNKRLYHPPGELHDHEHDGN